MLQPRAVLGDSHNFGRRVTLGADRVLKPRPLLWEWAFLGNDSPLRKYLDQAAADGDAAGWFDFIPRLRFFRGRARNAALGGEVERLALSPLRARSAARLRELASIVGRSLAVWSWFGVSDLHWENLVLGVDQRGRTLFGPIDIEMIFGVLALPTETKLLPDADPEYAEICRHACGVRRALPYLGKPLSAEQLLALLAAYRRTLALLDRHSSAIAGVFSGLPGLSEAPIRICLRSTAEYVELDEERLWPPLLDAEREQLARGDVPYFFRLYGQPGIHYYADPDLKRLRQLPSKGDVPKLDPMLSLARGLRSPTRKKLREEGLFAVIGAFDAPAFDGTHTSDELSVAFKPRDLIVKFANGSEMQSRRDLSAFVGSVYLPCHCGEVRSVFVPTITRCDAPLHESYVRPSHS